MYIGTCEFNEANTKRYTKLGDYNMWNLLKSRGPFHLKRPPSEVV